MNLTALFNVVRDRLNLLRAPSVDKACASLSRTLDTLYAAEEAAADKATVAETRAAAEVQKAIALRSQAARARRVAARVNELLD